MSDKTAVQRFEEVLENTVRSKMKRVQAKREIEKAIKDLSFLHERLMLEDNDPSYEFRYYHALAFWKEASGEQIIGNSKVDKLVKDLKEELRQKENFYIRDAEEHSDHSDGSLKVDKKYPGMKGWEEKQVVGYVTTISKGKIFVKPIECERELEVVKQEIPISCDLTNPGDEVEVTVCAKQKRFGRNLSILKCTELSSNDEYEFIGNFKKSILSEDSDALTVFHFNIERCKGIWDYIMDDKRPPKKPEVVKDILKASASLSLKLSKGSGKSSSCRKFLENLSSSSFFVNSLPAFIKDSIQDPCSDEAHNIETLLKLIVELSPSSAKKAFKIALCLANSLINSATDLNGTKNHGRWGTQLLASLGATLTKSIRGAQEVDTTHCRWDELPTIITQKELFSEHDIKCLHAIKRNGSYESIGEYLETNYRLLREECFRNLYTGIQIFCESREEHDPRRMNIYKIILDGMALSGSKVSIKLKYEVCGEPENEDDNQESKGLLYGSLMCISLDKTFNSPIWATVGSFPKERLRDSNTRIVYVNLCSERNNLMDAEVLLELQVLTQKGDHAIMAESPAFFQAFGPSMDRLTEALISNDIPFKDEIIFAKKSVPPDYTLDEGQECNWSIIFQKKRGYELKVPDAGKCSPVKAFKSLKEMKVPSLLDETQLRAIEMFLENRVALIQGPPGTGKSFIGTKILQLMLSMEIQKRYKGPILVMTYKNYALDHFLKMCLEYHPNILRIGKSDENTTDQLKEINLRNVRGKEGLKKDLYHKNKLVKNKINRVKSKLEETFRDVMNPRFTLKSFLQESRKCHIRSLLTGPEPDQRKINEIKDLLSEWKGEIELEEGLDPVLKDLVKSSLNEWLPKKKLEEAYLFNSERKKDSETRNSCLKSCLNDETSDSQCEDEAWDLKVMNNERLQDADEDSELSSEMSKSEDAYNDCSDSDINIPLAFTYFMTEEGEERVLPKLHSITNLWTEPEDGRVNFVYALQYNVVKRKTQEFRRLFEKYSEYVNELQEIEEQQTVDIMKKYDVIGMTITGAAMRLRLLNQIKPCAVIVEEAAEILEGQLISVIPPSVKHLVMLGDQKQLKPPVSCYDLKRLKNLDCSMFERLINNNLNFQQLGTQCRMRDDIAQLLRELKIYGKLETNTEKTKTNHPPECIGHSLFFWDHTTLEEDVSGTNSKYNREEINKITEVAKYLVRNDYPPKDITVLCAYRVQVQRMTDAFKKASEDPKSESFPKLKDIKITTVDSFQGEENKVILLSLVRSNRDFRIGFLAEEGRICVAISRARCSLYLFGNATVYKRSKNWRIILDFLERKKLVGRKFPFKENLGKIRSDKEVCLPLSERDIEQISGNISTKWDRLARLLNMEEGFVDDIRTNTLYPDARSKAVKVLQQYRNDAEFDLRELIYWLQVLEIRILDDWVKYIPSKSDETTSSLQGEDVSFTTHLSPRERERLSTEIIGCWQRLASLLNLPSDETDAISKNQNLYPEEIQKASKMLGLYNNKPYFSREELGKYLEEVGLSNTKTKVLNGTLRK